MINCKWMLYLYKCIEYFAIAEITPKQSQELVGCKVRRTVCVWPLLRLLRWLSNQQHFLLPEWQKSPRAVCEEDLYLFNYGLFWGKNRKMHRGSERGFKGRCSGCLRTELPRLLPEMCPSVYSVSLPQWACATFQTGGTSGKTVCKFEAHLKFVTLSVCCYWREERIYYRRCTMCQ